MFIMHLVVPLYYPIWQVGKIAKKFSVHVHVWRERGLPTVKVNLHNVLIGWGFGFY